MENTPILINNKRKSKTSWVWDYSESGDKQVFCKICNSYVKWNNNGTTQMRAHLNSKHKVFKINCHLKIGISQNELHDLNYESEEEAEETNVNKRPKIHDKLVEFVIGCSLPNLIVNNLYFRNLIKALVSDYKLPSRDFFSNTLIP